MFNTLLQRIFYFSWFGLVLAFWLVFPTPSLAAGSAVISTNPSTGSYHVSDTFDVSIKIDSTTSFNTASANVQVSSNLSVQSLTSGDCNFSYIPSSDTPTTTNPSFSGGIFGNPPSACTVYTLTLQALSEGTGTIMISNPQVLSSTDSSSIPTSVTNGTYIISGNITPSSPTPSPTTQTSPQPGSTSTPTSHPATSATPRATSTPRPRPSLTPHAVVQAVKFSPSPSPQSAVKQFDLDIKLTDSNGNPLIGVPIYLFSSPKEAITDSSGTAHFKQVDPGEHRLEVTYQGVTTDKVITLSGPNQLLVAAIQIGGKETGFPWWIVFGVVALVLLLTFWEMLLYNHRLSRRLRRFLYYDIVQYFRVRYISLRYVKKVHFPHHRHVSLKKRLHTFWKYGFIHKYKLKLISYLYIPEIKKRR